MAAPRRSRSALAALTITNLVLMFLIVAFGGLFFVVKSMLIRPKLQSERLAEYTEEARRRIELHNQDLESELTSLTQDIMPPIAEAVRRRAKQDYGRYVRTLEREGTVYLANVERIFTRKVRARYADFIDRHREILVSEFPSHANQENVERVLQDFEDTFSSLAERYFLDEFHRESARTQALWQRFPPARIPSMNEPSLEEQLVDTAADWAVLVTSTAPQDFRSQ